MRRLLFETIAIAALAAALTALTLGGFWRGLRAAGIDHLGWTAAEVAAYRADHPVKVAGR